MKLTAELLAATLVVSVVLISCGKTTVQSASDSQEQQGQQEPQIQTEAPKGVYLTGTPGPDALRGGAGGDHLTGGSGADLLDGGAGYNWARYDSATKAVIVDLDEPARNAGDARGDKFVSIRGAVGSPFNDQLAGDSNPNDLHGMAGDDLILGRGGDDNSLSGEDGNDTLDGGPGSDYYYGGPGDDILRFKRGEAQGDSVELEGAGEEGGDMLIFEGYGPRATFARTEGSRCQVRTSDGLLVETLRIQNAELISPRDYRFK